VIPPKVRGLISRPPVARQAQIDNAWDPSCRRVSCGVHNLVAVRVRRPMTTGVHVWEVTWERADEGYPVIGVGTDIAKMNAYIGYNDDSWGWNLGAKVLFHGGRSVGRYPSNKDPNRYSVPNAFHIVLDMDEGTLSFVDGDEYLGVAFSGLRGRSLYVMASMWANEQVSIKYHGVL
jgi:SPRY domain-containing SOCS box protein 1/4